MGTYDTRSGHPVSPAEIEIAPSALQDAVLGLLEEAGIDTETNDKIMVLIEEAELSLCEKAWERQQERLMENGAGPTLQEQQAVAMKLK